MNQQFPWWVQKLLAYYEVPDYIVCMLEQPWIPMAILGGMATVTITTILYATYRVVQERKKRKAIEIEHAACSRKNN